MSDRVHPRDIESPAVSGEQPKPNPTAFHRSTPSQDSTISKDSFAYSGPPSGTYVIQVPKDQIYRVPPPENAHKYKLYTARKNTRGSCRCCCCATLGIFILLIALIAATVGIFYLIYQPKAPSFSVDRVSVNGVNITSSKAISPVFNVTVKAENINGKVGIYYSQGSSVTVSYNKVKLCEGALPVFYQPPRNTTVFSTKLDGGEIVLSSEDRERLEGEQKKGRVPLKLTVELPVRVRFGSFKTWKLTAKGECTVTLNALTAKAKVVSKECSISVKPW